LAEFGKVLPAAFIPFYLGIRPKEPEENILLNISIYRHDCISNYGKITPTKRLPTSTQSKATQKRDEEPKELSGTTK
jgi:hypothetical protein